MIFFHVLNILPGRVSGSQSTIGDVFAYSEDDEILLSTYSIAYTVEEISRSVSTPNLDGATFPTFPFSK